MGKQTSFWFGTKCPALLYPKKGRHEMMLRSGLTVMKTRSCRNCGIYEDATPCMPDGRPMPIRMIDQMIGGSPQGTFTTTQNFIQQSGSFTHNPSGGSQYLHQAVADQHGNWYWRP